MITYLRHKRNYLRSIFRREEGLTLIEVAAALVILSIISLYFLSYFTNNATYSKITNQRLSATQLANAKLHECQSLGFTALQGLGCGTQSYNVLGEDPTPDKPAFYTALTSVRSGPSEGIVSITVTVKFKPKGDMPDQIITVVGAVKKDPEDIL